MKIGPMKRSVKPAAICAAIFEVDTTEKKLIMISIKYKET
jgi:hypothetical protein